MNRPPKSSIAMATILVYGLTFVPTGIPGASFATTIEADPQSPQETAPPKTIVDLSEQELRNAYRSELSQVAFDQNQEELGVLLRKVGENVGGLFHNFNDTSCREQIVLRRIQMLSKGQTVMSTRSSFDYLILVRSAEAGVTFNEERTDRDGNPVQFPTQAVTLPAKIANMSGFVVTSGFASLCIYLHPSHQSGSRFRLLGKERGGRHLWLIAFAQKPDVGDFQAAIGGSAGLTPVLLQGLIWVDPHTFQIVHMQTNLLEPDTRDFVTRQTTEIWLNEFKFADSQRAFWLPQRVEVTILFAGMVYQNTHSYSNYKLFRVETRIRK